MNHYQYSLKINSKTEKNGKKHVFHVWQALLTQTGNPVFPVQIITFITTMIIIIIIIIPILQAEKRNKGRQQVSSRQSPLRIDRKPK